MKKELTVKASRGNYTAVEQFITEALEEAEASPKEAARISIAVDEVFTNIVSYAYGRNDDGEVTVSVDAESNRIVLVFTDSGIPFNPLQKSDPDITLPAESRSIGGLGIYVVKNTMDDVSYEYKNGKNILTIVKNINR